MAVEDLDELLERMPEMAAAVNGFTSEVVQQEAFAALVLALTGRRYQASADEPHQRESLSEGSVASGSSNARQSPETSQKSSKRREGGGSRDGIRVVRDLNLRPDGKKSFEEFVGEKRPKSNEDKYAVVVYYLEIVLELSGITADYVGTVFRLTKDWREPGGIGGALRATASRKGTIDTSDPVNIRTTVVGRNFVEHDLPLPEKQKK